MAPGVSVPNQSDIVGSGVTVDSMATPVGTPVALAEEVALGLTEVEEEALVDKVALGLKEAEADAEEDPVKAGEALAEGEAEGDGEPLALPLGEALVLMLPVAVPGGWGARTTPSCIAPCAAYPAPRLVGVLALERTGGRVGLEVFVDVRVEVWVCVVVPLPGPDEVGVGAEEAVGGAPLAVPPAALPLGVGAAVVTSRYSTLSTRVTLGVVTLMEDM